MTGLKKPAQISAIDAAAVGALDKNAPRYMQGHKYDHGHLLVLAGGAGRTGAARLAARGALRIGAGVVTLGVPPAAQLEVATQVTAVMIRRVADADGLRAVLSDERINVLCLGPALGLGEREAALVGAALDATIDGERPVVLDADALTLIARDPALFVRVHAGCVLTPHAGEFARLFGDIAERFSAGACSKSQAACEAAQRAGCTVLLKGPQTVVADAAGTVRVLDGTDGGAWLASAGTGDVLAGFVAGLLARGFAPVEAAATGAALHLECARAFGPGLIAEDVPEVLPQVLRALLGKAE